MAREPSENLLGHLDVLQKVQVLHRYSRQVTHRWNLPFGWLVLFAELTRLIGNKSRAVDLSRGNDEQIVFIYALWMVLIAHHTDRLLDLHAAWTTLLVIGNRSTPIPLSHCAHSGAL